MLDNLKVLLVNAPPLSIAEPWFDEADWPRDALPYLAGYLRQYPGFEIRIIDAKYQRLDFQDVLREALGFRPDVVGLCALTNEIKPAAYLASLLKEHLPKAITVVGGAHVTAIPDATLCSFPMIDVGVVGEGEITFFELCEAIRAGETLHDIPGLCFREGERIVRTENRERILDQDRIPDPAFDLLPPAKEYWVQAVRGCPFSCHFCMNHNGRVPRKRSVARIVDQIESLINRFGAQRIHFGDEIFTIDPSRTHELMDQFLLRGFHQKITWDCQTHVRFVDRDLLVKMKQAGCVRVDMGIESGDREKLRSLGKGTNLEMIEKAFDAARQAGMPFGTLLIIGHPDETHESLQQTLDLAVRFNPDTPFISVMTPFPGTEVSRMAAAGEGGYRLVSTDWDDYSKMIGGALEFAGLTKSRIVWLQLWGYVRVFLYNRRFWDLAKFVWEYRRAGIKVFLSAVLPGVNLNRRSRLRPKDYEERLRAGTPATAEDVIRGRVEWEAFQKSEVQRARAKPVDSLPIVSIS